MKYITFGSLNIDRFYAVNEIAKPGHTIACKGYKESVGGKGLNQSIAMARAGLDVVHFGTVGSDGAILIDYLKDNGVDTSFIRRSGLTGHAIIQVDDQGENAILLYGGANHQVSDVLIGEFRDFIQKGDVVILQNEINRLEEVLEVAFNQGCSVVLNPSPYTQDLNRLDLGKVDLLVVNEHELEMLSMLPYKQALRDLTQKHPNLNIVLTRGSKGAVFASADTFEHVAGMVVDVVNTTGAGDTFLGYFVAGYFKGHIQKALTSANVAAGIAVTKEGSAESIPKLNKCLT